MACADSNKKERFSLLLLEPAEIYFEDFAVYYYPPGLSESETLKKQQKGRLKLCSKSLVFDPTDSSCPVLKFALKNCKYIEQWKGSLMSKLDAKGNVIIIECTYVVEMLAGNVIAPYVTKEFSEPHMFSLVYCNITDCLPQMAQLLRASTLPPAEQVAMMAAIVHSRQSRMPFNICWLDGLHEEIIFETQGNRITPLVTNPGRIVLTTSRIYFQPYNNADPLKIKLEKIKRLVKRRYLLREVGLELFFSPNSSVPQIFFSLKSVIECDIFCEQLLQSPAVKLDDPEPENMTLLWQNRVISNYSYLMYLNSVADRSFNDLTQYPIFPWVLANYSNDSLDLEDPASYRDLSKPVGALNEERLTKLKERYREMSEPKFLYGSHYSAPGFVLYYLVRKMPQYMLCLQNGRFDQPDRMFHSMADTWRNITTSSTDFKELIPEFYQPENKGDFLVNSKDLDFGVRQTGKRVGNVELPPWAVDHADFIQKMHDALESDIVSNSLHHWIDLIFGCKQRGFEAEKADNVFYYLTYEGAVELDQIEDINKRYSMEVQITEFGQVPRQIFKYLHPCRNQISNKEELKNLENDSVENQINFHEAFDALEIESTYQLHKEAINAVRFSEDGQSLFTVSQDNLLKMYSIKEKRQLRSINVSNMALSCFALLPDGKTVIIGSWDNYIYIYNIEYGKTVDSTVAHDDAISDLCWNDGLVVTSSWDTTVKIWNCDMRNGGRKHASVKLQVDLDHDTPVHCVALNSTNSLLLIGTDDGQVHLRDLSFNNVISQHQVFTTAVRSVAFSADGRRFICCGEGLRMFDVDTSTEIYRHDSDEELRLHSSNDH